MQSIDWQAQLHNTSYRLWINQPAEVVHVSQMQSVSMCRSQQVLSTSCLIMQKVT